MELNEFIQLIETQESCPESWSGPLQALWHDRKGDWDKAHQIVQDASDPESKRVHAYLHRKQGDLGNARYWYKRSRQPEFQGGLNQEWEQIATDLLAEDLEKV